VLLAPMVANAQVTSAPTGKPTLYADAVAHDMIALKWSDVEGETQYRIERKNLSGQWVEIDARGGNSANYLDSGLLPNKLYAYRVRGWNDLGYSEYSNEAAATTWPAPGVVPSAPRVVSLFGTDTSLDLQWDLIDGATGYRLESKTTTGTWAEIANVASPVHTYQHTNLTHSTDYYYRIRAYNAAGLSPYSEIWQTRTLPPPPPSTELTGVARSYNELELLWTDVLTNKETMLNYIGYRVQVPNGPDWKDLVYRGVDHTNYIVRGLQPAMEYSFRIRAENPLASDWSYVTLKTSDAPAIAPQTPVLHTVRESASSIRVKWVDVELETEYRIERKNSAGQWEQIGTAPANALFYIDGGLEASTLYAYRIRAANSYGVSGYSNESAAVTGAPPAPIPMSIQVASISVNDIRVRVAGGDGQKFKVQSSAGFSDWVDASEALTLGATGRMDVTVGRESTAEKTFYRVIDVQ
jgi:hypothetical protein